MKKIIFLGLLALLSVRIAYGKEIINGIDIDNVYSSSDWNNKEEIKQIIKDYELLLQFRKKLASCNDFTCLDNIAKQIIYNFYPSSAEQNFVSYQTYSQAVFNAYSIINCLDKYNGPNTICSQITQTEAFEIMKQYCEKLLKQPENHLNTFTFLTKYKK